MKIRTITGFMDWNKEQDIGRMENNLQELKQLMENAEFEVQTVRLTTNLVESSGSLAALEENLTLLSKQLSRTDLACVHLGGATAEREWTWETGAMSIMADFIAMYQQAYVGVDLGDQWPVNRELCRKATSLCFKIARKKPFDCFRLGVYAFVKEATPFYPASKVISTHDSFAIGLQNADIINEHLEHNPGPLDVKLLIRKLEVAYEQIGAKIPPEITSSFLGFDTSIAPFPDDRYSIGRALEFISGTKFGTIGTLSACRVLTHCMKTVSTKKTGLCGLMLPPMEDHILAERQREGTYGIKDLLLYSTVCATGLDTVILSSDEDPEVVTDLYQDLGNLAAALQKPLSARLMLVADKSPGQMVEFESQYVCDTPVMQI